MTPMFVDALECSNWDRRLFEELRRGALTCVHVTCAFWEDGRATLDNVARWYRWFDEYADLICPVSRGPDIQAAHAAGKTGIILGFQNASPIEDDLALVEVFYRLGVRVMQLTYNNQSLLGGGCYEADDGGLSRFGREVVREMNRLGMVIDLSHVGERTALDAIETSTRPVAITHANPSFFHPARRNKSDALLKALAGRGGVLGCTLYPHLIGGRHLSLEAWAELIARTVDLLGLEHVGIGSDLARNWSDDHLAWMRAGRWTRGPDFGAGSAAQPGWPRWPDWFNSPADFPRLRPALLAQGFAPHEADQVVGGNWLRFFAEAFEAG